MNEIEPQPREYWTRDTLVALVMKLMPRSIHENHMDIFPVKLGVVANRHGWTQPLLAVTYYCTEHGSDDSVVPSIHMLQGAAQSRAPVALKIEFEDDVELREAFFTLLNQLNVVHLSTEWTGHKWLDDIRKAHLDNVESIYVEEDQSTQKRMPKLCAIDFCSYMSGRRIFDGETICRIFKNVPLNSIEHIKAAPMFTTGARAVEQLLTPGGTLTVTLDVRCESGFRAVADIVVNKRVSALVVVSECFISIRDSPILQLENTNLQRLAVYLNIYEYGDADADVDYRTTGDLIEPLVDFARRNHRLTEIVLSNQYSACDVNERVQQRMNDAMANALRERVGRLTKPAGYRAKIEGFVPPVRAISGIDPMLT